MPEAAAPRRAQASELQALARMLARAFHDDPVATWSCPPVMRLILEECDRDGVPA